MAITIHWNGRALPPELPTAEIEFERRILFIAVDNPEAAQSLASRVAALLDPIDAGMEGVSVTNTTRKPDAQDVGGWVKLSCHGVSDTL